jgi:hypothetical protein
MAREYDTPRTVSLEINVRLAALERKQSGYLPAAVYAFARSGQLVDKLVLRTSGCARLNLPDLRVTQEVRVMVGPDAPAVHSTVGELSRRGAREQFVRISPTIEPPLLEFDIEASLRSLWARRCAVRGVLRRKAEDRGTRIATPVDEATVQIWEIEPVELMIAKLPDTIIDDFRELLLEAAGVQAQGGTLAPTQRTSLRAARLHFAKPLVAAHMQELKATAHFGALVQLARESTAGLRDHLVQTSTVVRLLLCLLYPAWIRKHMIGSAATDADGHFDALVFPSSQCANLNLYFTASATYRGASVPVYDPRPVATSTYWDYESGTEVELVATGDPTTALAASPARDVTPGALRLLAAGNA